jgi:hypothetical protein
MSARAQESSSSSDVEVELERGTLTERPAELVLADPKKVASMSTSEFMALNKEIQDRQSQIKAEEERRRKAKQGRDAEREERANVASAEQQLVKDAKREAMEKKRIELLTDLAKLQGEKKLGPVPTLHHHDVDELRAAMLEDQLKKLREQMKREGLGHKKRTYKRHRQHKKKSLKMRKKSTKKVNHHKKNHKSRSKSRRVKK